MEFLGKRNIKNACKSLIYKEKLVYCYKLHKF